MADDLKPVAWRSYNASRERYEFSEIGMGTAGALVTHADAEAEIERLKLDLRGYMTLCNEHTVEIERLRAEFRLYKDALWKACGDDEALVKATLESQGAA